MLDAIRSEEAGMTACGRQPMGGGHAGATMLIVSAPVRVMDTLHGEGKILNFQSFPEDV